MINKSIIKAILSVSTKEAKDIIINELLNHISINYDYNDKKATHILEMLADPKTVISDKDIDTNYINENLNLLMYNHDKYNIRNIKVTGVDNIDGTVRIDYEYLEKINEDRDDVSYSANCTYISFIDEPDILINKC